ncbi:family 2 glycosyltransferase [Macrophomina phaseolina]|uniref:Family 2 glycosyltransferase n=1 Tax=Macrophomina phaseolina TaxID=35725 RepID=A0ABQ8GP55_9PEZI|nr:family 2 glycosyltransferase [Macrophomina phaseolina]
MAQQISSNVVGLASHGESPGPMPGKVPLERQRLDSMPVSPNTSGESSEASESIHGSEASSEAEECTRATIESITENGAAQSSPPDLVPKPSLPEISPTSAFSDPSGSEIDISRAVSPAVVEPEKEKSGTDIRKPPTSGFFRIKEEFFAIYAPRVEPPLVLPYCPTDTEKYSYLKTNRIPLYAIGCVSFLSLSAGMWLFVLSSVYFAWFGVLAFLLQLYLFISYLVGIVGRDWDFKNHEKLLQDYPITEANAPTVDIYLPCCKEPLEILENTYKHIRALEYPKDKLRVYVLDDGAMESVERLAQQYGFTYMVRDDRPRLKKAGNLRWAFSRTAGDFFVIFDADFCPRPDFIRELLPHHLCNPKSAIVQSPQFFRTLPEHTWVEQGAGACQELFYRVVQVNRNRWGASICVGSNAVYRREALAEVGGTAEIGYSEDVHTGFGAVDRGWTVEYVPLCLAAGVCPDNPRAFFSQQMRWCMGSTTLLTNPEFWRSKLSFIQKVCYLSGMMYYSALSLSIFINPLPGMLLLWVRPEFFKFYNLAFAIPSILYGVICLRFWAKASYGLNVQYVMVIQQYAYLNAIKDRLFGNGLAWAPSGDAKAHKNNKYRNMRILAWGWLIVWESALIAAIVYRILLGLEWWNIIPILVLNVFNFVIAHRFLLCKA